MRKKLGIIDFGRLEITLGDAFGSESTTDITSLLSEEQKKILENLSNISKLIYVDILVTDSSSDTMSFKGIAPITSYADAGSIDISGRDQSDTIDYVTIYYDVNKYWALS